MSAPNQTAFEQRLSAQLARLREADLYRTRRVIDGGHGVRMRVNGRDCLNFCSNDYLGLASHPAPARAAQAALGRGVGSGASALVSGYNCEQAALEEELAAFLGRERALVFSSGWAANVGALRGLLGKEDVLVADELNHASLIDGGRLSGARYVRAAHGDRAAFELALQQNAPGAGGMAMLVTDSVFSMDGDLAPLPALAALAARHEAALMVDDAHGFGVLGQGGRGAAALLEGGAPEVLMAGFGKALGTAGAAIAGSAALIETLVQKARSYVFSTAPPPALAAASRAALAIIASEEGEALRARLFDNIRRFRSACAARGIALGGSDESLTPIQPLVLGPESLALSVSASLMAQGYWVAAIRPPTVPTGTSRLRITLSAAHSHPEIDSLVAALAKALQPA